MIIIVQDFMDPYAHIDMYNPINKSKGFKYDVINVTVQV